MRKLVVSSLVLTLIVSGSHTALAQNGLISQGGVRSDVVQRSEHQNAQWENYSANEQAMLDRVAADFFQSSLRLAQSREIEASTANIYMAKSLEERAVFREERQAVWNAMSKEQQRSLRNVKMPAYSNLTESQKAPFRNTARNQLSPASTSQNTNEASAYSGGDV